MNNGEMTEEQALIGTTYEFGLDDKGRITLYYPVNKSIREASETTAKTIQAYTTQKILEELENLCGECGFWHNKDRAMLLEERINQLKGGR